jgi:hypothetical protein
MAIRSLAKSLLVALAVVGASQLLLTLGARRRASRRQAPAALQTWEGEGGAVPVDDHRTAAAVRPSGDEPGAS